VRLRRNPLTIDEHLSLLGLEVWQYKSIIVSKRKKKMYRTTFTYVLLVILVLDLTKADEVLGECSVNSMLTGGLGSGIMHHALKKVMVFLNFRVAVGIFRVLHVGIIPFVF